MTTNSMNSTPANANLPASVDFTGDSTASQEQLRILVVDDDDADRLAIRRYVLQTGGVARLDEAVSGAETLELMAETDFDCILLDYYLPSEDGLALLNAIHERAPRTSVVILTGRGDEELAVALMKAGAADYLPKASLTPARIASSLRHVLAVAREAAERRRAEAELRAQEARFRRALEIETVGVLFFTTDGQITATNDAFLRMAGYTREDVLANRVRWDELTPPEWVPRSLQAIEEYKATGRTTPYEKEYVRKDGTRWWGLIAATRLNDREGVGFVLDISERKRAEKELARLLTSEHAARQEAEAAVTARDEFVAVVSHDLRNPVTALQSQLQMLHRQVIKGKSITAQELSSRLEKMKATVTRVTAQIDELQDTALLQAGRPLELECRPTDLVMLVRQTVDRYQDMSPTHRLDFNATVPKLIGSWDAGRLARAVANLVSNAIKYSPSGGVITLTVSRDGEWGILSVEDHGIGIPAQDLDKVFERYQRASNVTQAISGTGLGLASARDILQRHGGSITVQSQEGAGAIFTVRLPGATEQPPGSDTPLW